MLTRGVCRVNRLSVIQANDASNAGAVAWNVNITHCLDRISIAHPTPKEKTMLNRRFLLVGVSRRHNSGMGRPSMAKSVTMLRTPPAIIRASRLIHLPGTAGFHNFLKGTH